MFRVDVIPFYYSCINSSMAKYQKKGQIQVLTGFTVVITMPYIEIWNHDIVHLKLIYYVS